MTNDLGKVTIYKQNEFFGTIQKVEARACEVERGPYAQYSSAIKVTFVKKGARKTRGFYETYEPRLLILAGHGHPDPAGMYDGGEVDRGTPGIVMRRSKHLAFDGGYAGDFDELIDKYIADSGAEVLVDARGEHIS